MKVYLHERGHGKYKHFIVPEIYYDYMGYRSTLILVCRGFDFLLAFEDVRYRMKHAEESTWEAVYEEVVSHQSIGAEIRVHTFTFCFDREA